MIRGIFVFLLLFGIFYAGIASWRSMTKLLAWSILKTVTISLLAASAAAGIVATIVYLF
jgi:hypothetical protein